MGVVNRKSVASPTLPKETVSMPGLEGEVIVCGLRLTDRLGLQNRMAARRHSDDEADVYDMVPELLSLAVIDAEAEPLFTREQWENYGSDHAAEVLTVFAVAMRLSGFSKEEDEKN